MRTMMTVAAVAATAMPADLAAPSTAAPRPMAKAVGSGHCDKNIADHWRTVDDLAGVRVRTGPSAAYPERYHLDFAGHLWVTCQVTNGKGNVWFYGKDRIHDRWGYFYGARTTKGKS
ncbi:hypothetical protein [Streptomyces mesophilus]|uniref:hypothetical protein n=1 Tax=Streptomyces mesophilus TaxID=1775132 RepID=UPI00331953A2